MNKLPAVGQVWDNGQFLFEIISFEHMSRLRLYKLVIIAYGDKTSHEAAFTEEFWNLPVMTLISDGSTHITRLLYL